MLNNPDRIPLYQTLPAWIGLLIGWIVAAVGWAFRIEKMMARSVQRQDAAVERENETAGEVKDLSRKMHEQSESIVELKTDVRYIREGIDELRRRKRSG